MGPDCFLTWNLSPEDPFPTRKHRQMDNHRSSALKPPRWADVCTHEPCFELSVSVLACGPTYSLSEGVHAVGDLEVGRVLAELPGQLFRGEAHGADVVGPHGQAFRGGFHDFQGGPEAVTDVHHWEPGAGLEVALKCAVFGRSVENLDCVV